VIAMSMLTNERALEVLRVAKERLGPKWKMRLRVMWDRAGYPGLDDVGGELQQLRNSVDLPARKLVTGRGEP
jgi:hypothetical protein